MKETDQRDARWSTLFDSYPKWNPKPTLHNYWRNIQWWYQWRGLENRRRWHRSPDHGEDILLMDVAIQTKSACLSIKTVIRFTSWMVVYSESWIACSNGPMYRIGPVELYRKWNTRVKFSRPTISSVQRSGTKWRRQSCVEKGRNKQVDLLKRRTYSVILGSTNHHWQLLCDE